MSGRFASLITAVTRSSAVADAIGLSIGCGGTSRYVRLFGGDIFRKLQMNRTRPFLDRDTKCITDNRRNGRRRHDLTRHLRQRPHRRDDIDNLEARLAGTFDGLLTRDHQHRHRTEMCVGCAGREVERAWPERRQTNTRSSRQPPLRSGHEGRGLFVPG